MFLPNRKQISGERHITASNRDNGHFFNCETNGDFTAELRVRAQYDELYDQAGIMVRIDDAHWVEAGIEMSDGKALLSSVLTVGQSDWAPGSMGTIRLIFGCARPLLAACSGKTARTKQSSPTIPPA
jgi:hypothetical protein